MTRVALHLVPVRALAAVAGAPPSAATAEDAFIRGVPGTSSGLHVRVAR